MYHNIEVISRNTFSGGKAIRIKLYKCVCVWGGGVCVCVCVCVCGCNVLEFYIFFVKNF